ncbi:MAG TPA: hypothetical protein DGP25_07145, partial [Brevundimonas sp.]|nr:hypothetical protein [Brevundimonas sp.]
MRVRGTSLSAFDESPKCAGRRICRFGRDEGILSFREDTRKSAMKSIVLTLSLAAAIAAIAAGTASASSPASPGEPCRSLPTSDGNDAAACKLADLLERMFIIPEQGARYAAGLRAAVSAGRYTQLSKAEAAKALTSDLQATAPDGHLHVWPVEPEVPAAGHAASPARAPIPKYEQPGWIAPGVAYVRINEFPDDSATTRAMARFMADHAGARALIFDLRTHHGGGVQQMDVMLPWLFAQPTRLVTMESPRAAEQELGSPIEGVASMRLVPDAKMVRREHWVTPNADARLRKAKVYLLTGPRTASAAEHFALAMNTTRRATLVGEPTAGANHFGGQVDLPGGLAVFLPVGRTYDPATGKDWEGAGVAPDVAVAKEQALEWTLTDLGLPAAAAKALSDSH